MAIVTNKIRGEEWRLIPGSRSGVEVSNMGRLRLGERISTGAKTRQGYRAKAVEINGVVKFRKVHRLVLLAFVGQNKLEVNHKNGIKHDNRLENLEYSTRLENMRHALRLGLRKGLKGESNGTAKLTEKEVYAIRADKKATTASLARRYKVSEMVIYCVRIRKSWKHLPEKELGVSDER